MDKKWFFVIFSYKNTTGIYDYVALSLDKPESICDRELCSSKFLRKEVNPEEYSWKLEGTPHESSKIRKIFEIWDKIYSDIKGIENYSREKRNISNYAEEIRTLIDLVLDINQY